MKIHFKRTLLLILATILFASSGFASSNPASFRYLIKLKNSPTRENAKRAIEGYGLIVKRHISEIDVYVADSKESQPINARQLENLQHSPEIIYVEQDALWHAISVPNDPLYSDQNETKRMDVETAWNTTTGSNQVVVATSDTGISLNHPDLKNQLWTNPQGGPDLHGYNFVNGTPDPSDDNGHGTHVAGILGAEGNNATGVAGVNWSVQIMALKFLNQNGSGSTEHGIDTILYAANHGARLINASWGGGSSSNALRDAISYAYDHGTLFIAAAGNNSANTDKTPTYPADYKLPGIISVGSSQNFGSLSSFSNFGILTVALAAPGSNILSTILNGRYGRLSGTSMAAPMVTGVGALILSRAPELSPLALRNAILNAVDERSTYSSTLSTSGDLSAKLAIEELSGGFQVWPSRISVGVGSHFQFTSYGASESASWSTSDPALATIDSEGDLTGLKAGTVQVTATDTSGHTASTQWVHIVTPSSTGGGGGGCFPRRGGSAPAPWEAEGAALSMSLPVFAGLWARSRRRRQSERQQ